jgi:hypothetical protein
MRKEKGEGKVQNGPPGRGCVTVVGNVFASKVDEDGEKCCECWERFFGAEFVPEGTECKK